MARSDDRQKAALALTEAMTRAWIDKETAQMLEDGKSEAEAAIIITAALGRPDFADILLDFVRVSKEALRRADEGTPNTH